MNVIEEKSLKDTRNVNLFYLLFWTSLYQLITVGALFWVDILPSFGFADGIYQFGQKWVCTWIATIDTFNRSNLKLHVNLQRETLFQLYG